MNFEWSKYKRFFTFGCSFTNYMWPSWADVVSKEMPQAEFYNFGMSGSGNTLISYRIAEANNRYAFNDTDLIMVMFSSYCREDRWLGRELVERSNFPGEGWLRCGSIYNTNLYPSDWVRNYADERGYMIRDAAVIDMTVNYLDNLPSTSFCMLSTDFQTNIDLQDPNKQKEIPHDIVSVYHKTFSRFKPSMYEFFKDDLTIFEHDYPFKDGHPSTFRYYDYLNSIGINLSDKTKQYAHEASEVLKSIKAREIVPLYFPENDIRTEQSLKLLF